MPPSIANCKKCNKVFQKVISDLCPPCINVEEEQFKLLYRTLQRSSTNGGISISELSEEVGISTEDIERFYLEGRLSTAGTLLKFECQSCGMLMRELQRRGRYCVTCSEKTASQAGVEVKSKQDLEKNELDAQRKQEQMEMLRKKQPPQETRRFGMVRNRF